VSGTNGNFVAVQPDYSLLANVAVSGFDLPLLAFTVC
jgi:hypothetical protein